MPTQIYREQVSQDPTNKVTRRYEERVIRTDQTPVRSGFFALSRFIYYLLDLVEIVLAVRFLFRLLAANPGSPFVRFVYALTNPLVAPFRGIFMATPTGVAGYLDWSTVVAMIVYAFAAYLIVQLFDVLSRPAA